MRERRRVFEIKQSLFLVTPSGVPFTTARPTLAETSRVVVQLSRAEYPDEWEVRSRRQHDCDAHISMVMARTV